MRSRFILFACITVLFSIFSSGCIRRATYPVPRARVVSPPPSPIEEIVLTGRNSKITGWFSQTEPHNDSTPVLLYLHGNDENLQTMLRSRIFGELARLRVHFFVIDYPGYGNSTGSPSEISLVNAADTAFAWICRNFKSNPKFVAGWSIGAAVAIQLSSRHLEEINGLIAVSAWTSMDSVAAHRYPNWLGKILLRDRYNSFSRIFSLDIPVLVMHGELDRMIPFMQGKALADNCPQLSKWILLKGSGHDDVLTNYRVWEEIGVFLRKPKMASE